MRQIPESELVLNSDGSIYHLGLLPEQLCETIFTVGDPERVSAVSKYFDVVEFKLARREFHTHIGRLNGKPVMVMSTGMGTDNIEILMNELDALVNIDLNNREIRRELKRLNIIRIGTSGALRKETALGSILYSEHVIGLDTLGAFYDFPHPSVLEGMAEAFQAHVGLNFVPYAASCSSQLAGKLSHSFQPGNTITCPGFYSPQGRRLRLQPSRADLLDSYRSFQHGDLRMTNFEMETAGYYGLGGIMGHDMLSLNAIVANRETNRFASNPAEVVDKLIKEALECFGG